MQQSNRIPRDRYTNKAGAEANVERPSVILMQMVFLLGFTAEMRLPESHSKENHGLTGSAPAHDLSVGSTSN